MAIWAGQGSVHPITSAENSLSVPQRSGLSKTLILTGMQCPRALWLKKNPPPMEIPVPPDLEARFSAGSEVGRLAQQLFPGGIEVPYQGLSIAEQLDRTRELVAAGTPVIYEASFEHNGVFVKVDILVRAGGGWDLYEVKMGTAVKEVNCLDVAVQLLVLHGCGIEIGRVYLTHIDNSYLRRGAVEVDRLFASEDLSAAAGARQAALPAMIAELRGILADAREPEIDIGPHCHQPYDCEFIPWCWRHLPEESVFTLSGRLADKFALYYDGCLALSEVPLDRLKEKQRFEAEMTLRRGDYVDRAGLQAFLDTLWHPLCHLDFETFSTPIPPFDGLRPYQQVPFQFSLHLQDCREAEPAHSEFLAEPGEDPRRELAERLLAAIPPEACLLTYNQAFEKGILQDLAAAFPDLAGEIHHRLDNVRDLLVPFRSRLAYRWQMRGSASIKAVLPAMVPELSYEGLAIADGGMAMLAWHEMNASDDPRRIAEIRRDLRAYCRLDTLAMVRILAELYRLAESARRPLR